MPAAYLVGFNGSQINGRSEIETELSRIFRNHPTAAYIGILHNIRFLATQFALLHAVAGMIPPGQADINPALNAIQTLVVMRENDQWLAAQMQTAPAQFHGRPELSEALTNELRKWL